MSMIAKQLQALEDPAQLMVTYSVASHRVSVSLPRFGLDFFLNDQVEPLLESANIPGMVVDKDQSSGTMIGFKNQLVLRQRDSPMSSLRQVIIPYASNAEFDISAFHHHHATMLSIGDQNMVRYFKYTIDPTLGRLEGDGSMLSRLYQVYLHAITSHCLPDPLTGQTGMEEALHQLSSAGMHSYQKLTGDERQMLYKLRNLTPIRTSYSHLSGHTMTILAQQENFHRLAISVLEHEDTVKMFAGISMDSHQADLGDFPRPSDQFQYRASCRNTFLSREQINGLGSRPSHQDDLPYVSRDGSEDTNQIDAAEVSNISTMVFNWEPKVDPRNQLLKVLGPCGMIPGVTEKVSLTYSHEWLNRKTLHFFLPACNACREASKAKNRYSIAFAFSAWAYTSQKIRPLIPIIFAFATVPELRALNPPSWLLYEPVEGVEPKEGKLSNIVMNCFMEPSRKHRGYEEVQWENDRRRASEVKELVTQLKQQWPCERPKVVMQASLFDIDRLNREAGKAFQTWFRNKHLFDYLQNVQYALNSLPKSTGLPLPYAFSPSTTKPQPTFDYVSFQQLFQERGAPTIPPPPTILRDSSWYKMESNAHNTQKLQDLIRQFRTSTYISDQSGPLVAIRQQYADDLEKSLNRLRMEHDTTIKHNALPTSRLQKVVQNYHRDCEKHLMVVHQNVWKSLSPLTESENALHAALLWPSLTIRSLLGALAFGGNVQLTGAWRKTLNSLARAVLAFQHACRLSKYMDDWKPEELHSELGSVIEKTEDDEQHSTRLLIQVDGNFLARPTQIDFTREMINPSSRSNSVFQLNMGEGKSSVILPMVAAALSDGKQLARVVVLKQLAPSMFHLLVQRLGGLANRRIFCMPFSRSLQLTDAQVQKIQHLHSMCVQTRGVLVMQPEHILSFKLLGLDRKFNASSSMLMPDKAISLSSPNSPALDVAKHLLDSQR
ncbi:hypothetical protein FRC02_002378 [Tulasnella sp. 418]|nr:hypothetical protein FRC02_002378 [Tulasnella sp. 418]